MQRTIEARTMCRVIDTLTKAETALTIVNDLRPMVPHMVWEKVWPALCAVENMRTELLRVAVTDVAVETMEAV